jgi:acetyl esterase
MMQEEMLMMDPHLRAMLDVANAVEMPPLEMIPAEFLRQNYRDQRMAPDPTVPTDLAVRDLQIAGAEGPIAARLYVPNGAPEVGPGIVYFHGGGFVIGDLDTHDHFMRRLSSLSGVKALAVDYRLAPEHKFPAPHLDAIAATKWAFDHAAEIGFDPARIAVGGCSAGGNLAASLSLVLRSEPQYLPAFQLLLYPATAMEMDTQSRKDLAKDHLLTADIMKWFSDHLEVGDHPDRHLAEPEYVKDLSGAPPALVVTAGFDPLKDEGKAHAARLKAAGVAATHVEYADMLHDFYILANVSPGVLPKIEATAKALKEALA